MGTSDKEQLTPTAPSPRWGNTWIAPVALDNYENQAIESAYVHASDKEVH